MLIKIGNALVDPFEIVAIAPDRDECPLGYEKAVLIRIELRHGGSLWIDATMDEAEAALIDAGVVTDLLTDLEPDDSPLQLTDEESERLRELESYGYKYLARDKDGKLYAFQQKPEYGGFYWMDPDPAGAGALRIDGFSFIGVDDNEPVEICRLLDC